MFNLVIHCITTQFFIEKKQLGLYLKQNLNFPNFMLLLVFN